jgi:hypothetical protein
VVVVVAGGVGMLGSIITAGIGLGLGFDAPFLKNPRQHNASNPSSGFDLHH